MPAEILEAEVANCHRLLAAPVVLPQVPGLCYHEGFLSEREESEILQLIDDRPGLWKLMSQRKLQNYGGLPHLKGMIPMKLPLFLEKTVDKLVDAEVFATEDRPNHALVNRYEAAGEGIDPHEDGPVFLSCAAILSLQSPIVMDFYEKKVEGHGRRTPVASIVLRPRSLLCIAGSAYTDFLHGIEAKSVDILHTSCVNTEGGIETTIHREQRTSVTLRRCRRTLKTRVL
jgi:alkylated DNA repair protein alkB homolog 6